jgi:hypothetical protein
MPKLIRRSVFETNSSSTHSLVITDAVDFDTVGLNDHGALEIPAQDFGWEVQTYSDAPSKMSYVAIYVRDWVKGDQADYFKKMLDEMLVEHTGATYVQHPEEIEGDYDSGGYIDHQSVEDRDLDHLFESKDTLKNFIFGRGNLLLTDNDNY